MSEEGKKAIIPLVQTYGIVDTGLQDRHSPTLPRLAAAFPELVVYLLDRSPKFLSMTFPKSLSEIPSFFKVSCFASVIPNDGTYWSGILRRVHLDMMVEADSIINGAEADRNRVEMFTRIAFNSRMFSAGSRIAILAQLPNWFEVTENGWGPTEKLEDILTNLEYVGGEDEPEMM